MWIKSIYGKAAFKRLKLYIWRAGTVTATPECQWPCGWRWMGARSFGLGSVAVQVVTLQNMVRVVTLQNMVGVRGASACRCFGILHPPL